MIRNTALTLSDLRVTYPNGVQALRGIDLDLAAGEAIAVVGESGCGKSTLAAAILRLLPDGAAVSGEVRLNGENISARDERFARTVRGRRVGLVVQDPIGSFNPVMRVGAQAIEARQLHHRGCRPAGQSLWDWVTHLLDLLQIPEAARRARQYPHEWSGGMLQRAAIAVATANDPPVLVADEPTASLDPSLAVDVLAGLRERQVRAGAALLLITHQLGLAAGVADRIAVMYAGRIVEIGSAEQVIRRPRHPYTRALIAALPRLGGGLPEPLDGEIPVLAPPPPGCAFSARCRLAVASCTVGLPPALVAGVACPVIQTQPVTIYPADDRG